MKKLLLFVLLVTAGSVSAQGLSVRAGLGVSTSGLIASDDWGEALAMWPGFDVGARVSFPTANRSLSLFASADVFGNMTYSHADGKSGTGYIDTDKESWAFNIPVMAGARFRSDFKVWAEAAVGVNLRHITAIEGTFSNSSIGPEYQPHHVSHKFGWGASFAFQVGAGVELGRFDVGLHFHSLGKIKLNETYTSRDIEREVKTPTTSNMATLRLGYNF